MLVSLPLFDHLVTVFGSTLNSVATSAGVSRASDTGAFIIRARLPGVVVA